MKRLLVCLLLVGVVGCGESEQDGMQEQAGQVDPNQEANGLFVEAMKLIESAESKSGGTAIRDYERALSNVQEIIDNYSKSDLAVKLISGEALFTGRTLASIREKLSLEKEHLIGQWPTVEEQFHEASRTNTEESLKSVERFFPPVESAKNQYFTYKSRQKLADLCLEQGRLDEAMTYYTELVNLGPNESLLQAFGLIGQINVHVRRDEVDEINEKIITIAGLSWGLDQSIPVEVIRDMLQKLDASLRETFEDVLLEILEADPDQ